MTSFVCDPTWQGTSDADGGERASNLKQQAVITRTAKIESLTLIYFIWS